MKLVFKRLFFIGGIFFFAALGALSGSWVFRGQYPVSEKTRIVLTPQVKAGVPVEVAREVDRRDNCDIRLTGYIEYANGKREPLSKNFDPSFGPLGYDGYIMEFPTSPNAVEGDAYIWSKPGAACNPLEVLFNWFTSGQERIDRFRIGPETIHLDLPTDFKIRTPAATTYTNNKIKAGSQ